MIKKVIYSNKYLKITEENEIIEVDNVMGGSVILPLTKQNEVVLIKTFRKTMGDFSIEVPRGFSENSESSTDTAIRELYEEIHYRCEKVISLGCIYPDTGLQTSKIQMYLGLNSEPVDKYVQTAEGIKEIIVIPFKESYKMALEGEINDSFTIAAILRSLNYIGF